MRNKAGGVLILIFLIINGIVLYNSLFHLPWIGYDAVAHIKNIEILSELRLPAAQETYLYYMPPLSYFLPALLYSLRIIPFVFVLKFAQLLNVAFSLGLTFYLLKICDIIRPKDTRFKIFSLGFLGMMPVYYKTFAFIRGEALISFLTVYAVYTTLIIFVENKHSMRNVIMLGVALGLALLSRQTGFFVILAIFIFDALLIVKKKEKRAVFIKAMLSILIISFIISGWFYLSLYKHHGSITTYNIKPKKKFSFSNQPPQFYGGLALNKLFSDPVRNSFPNRFFPMFYSEFWGDYLCYFLVYGKDLRNGSPISGLALSSVLEKKPVPQWITTNRYTVKKYLGRVNLVSLLPSAIMLAGFALGMVYFIKSLTRIKKDDERTLEFSLIQLIILVSFVAFFYFLIMYPAPVNGDNIKATYMLHTFPFLAILAGEFVCRIRERSILWYRVIVILLILTVLHNFAAFFTRYTL